MEMEAVEKVLRENFRGHPDFITMTLDELLLHSEKNYDYARSGPPLGNFLRVAAILRLYPGLDPGDPAVVAMVYMLKQLDSYFTMKSQGYEGEVETRDERLRDVHVYSKLARILDREGTGVRVQVEVVRQFAARCAEKHNALRDEAEGLVGAKKRTLLAAADVWAEAVAELCTLLEE